MNPEMKLVIVGALLLFALAFFFFGQSLVTAPTPDTIPTVAPTPGATYLPLGPSTG